MYYIMVKLGDFQFIDILWYAAFLMISIFSYTSLMDKHWIALPAEVIKAGVGFFLVFRMEGWYLIDAMLPGSTQLVMIYFTLSLLVTVYFLVTEGRTVKRTSLG